MGRYQSDLAEGVSQKFGAPCENQTHNLPADIVCMHPNHYITEPLVAGLISKLFLVVVLFSSWLAIDTLILPESVKWYKTKSGHTTILLESFIFSHS